MKDPVSWVAALALWAISPAAVYACETCFGAGVDTPTTRGISMAMLALLAMTGVVMGGIGAFFYNVNRRSRLMEPGDLVVTESGEIQEQPERERPYL